MKESRTILLFNEYNIDNLWVERKKQGEYFAAQVPDDKVMTADLDELSKELVTPLYFDVPVFDGDPQVGTCL
jgi:hypothetical protein